MDEVNKLMHWSENYAKSKGFRLNPDKEIAEALIKGLVTIEKAKGEKYCPCRPVTGNKEDDKKIICPCIYHEDEIKRDGHCHCRLFVK